MKLNIQEILDSCIGKYLVLTEVKYEWKYWESDRKNSKSASDVYINYHNTDVNIELWEEYVNEYIHSSKDERTKHSLIEKSLKKYKILSIKPNVEEDGNEITWFLEFRLEGFKKSKSGYFHILGNETFEIEIIENDKQN